MYSDILFPDNNQKGGKSMSGDNKEVMSKSSGFATAGLVLGIIGVCTSFIPIINNWSFVLGVLAIIFGVVAFFKKSGKVKVIIAIILGILAIAMTLSAQQSLSDSIDKMTGDSTEEVLANDAEVTLGSFEVTEGEYGITNTKLVVTVKNKTSEKKSFDFHIEAVDANGARVGDDYVYANDLASGQSQNFEIFNLVSSDKIEILKNATFKVIEASVY